jgi:hypothetical protein
VARYDLRLSDEEFYALTPRQFDALCKRHRMASEMTEFFFAQVSSTVMNTGFRSTEKPTSPADFMPSQRNKKPIKQRTSEQQSPEEVLDRIRLAFSRV